MRFFKEPRDRSSKKNALEMVLLEELLVCPFSVAATLLIFTATICQGCWFSRLVLS